MYNIYLVVYIKPKDYIKIKDSIYYTKYNKINRYYNLTPSSYKYKKI